MSNTKRLLNTLPSNRTKRAMVQIFGDNWPQVCKTLFDYSNGDIGSASGGGLSPLIWSDCPRGLMLVDPTVGHFVGDNFHTWYGDGYKYQLVGTNGTCVQVAAQKDGVVRLTTGSSDNDEAAIAYGNDAAGCIEADDSTDWWYEARVKVNQGNVAKGHFVGLAQETGVGADLFTDGTMAMKVIDSIGFQLLAATDVAATWQAVMQLAGGDRAAVDADVGTPSTTSYVKLGMKSTSSGNVYFFVDGAFVASTTSAATNFPLDQIMTPTFGIKTGKAAAVTLDIDWWYAAQLR